ncbi:hypothetical protein [Millisia brevis]|uniref:hypothetical protein n=1 Tax=Millisia brevis TaxID=264148 RepID=UPI00082C82AC|nr:hypothetical protein [Millisia brevis]
MSAPIRVLPRSLGVTVPLAALALAVAGCSTQQYASDIPGTTPPVWTGSTSPGSEADHSSEEGGAEVGHVVELITADGASIGTVQSTREGTGDVLDVDVAVEAGSTLEPGTYDLTFHTGAVCEPSAAAVNDAQFPFQSAGDELVIDGAAVPIAPLVIAADGSGALAFSADVPPETGSLIISRQDAGAQERQACAVLS